MFTNTKVSLQLTRLVTEVIVIQLKTFWTRATCIKGRNTHKRTSWKLVGNPGRELVTN